ncbi:MAG: YwiC-like family protein [Planctomycetaceae bacterium]|nr:YwiC-like family protein [Planctomycetaceae bacterium]
MNATLTPPYRPLPPGTEPTPRTWGDTDRPAIRPSRSVRLYPKEHGAYAILGVPLVTALFIVGLTPVTALLSIATIAAFLAHEPLLVLAGGRGARAKEEAPNARRISIVRLAVAAICGAAAFWLAGSVARAGMMICLLFVVVEFAVSATGHARTLAAQILALAGLALPSAVVLAAGGIGVGGATQFLLIWFAGRVATTVSVRLVIAQHKTATSPSKLATGDLLMLAAGGVCAIGLAMGDRQWLAAIPMLLAAVVLRFSPPHPKHLRSIGWSLLAVNVLSGMAIIWSMGHPSGLSTSTTGFQPVRFSISKRTGRKPVVPLKVNHAKIVAGFYACDGAVVSRPWLGGNAHLSGNAADSRKGCHHRWHAADRQR